MAHFAKGQQALIPEEVKICVLYDPRDGRIAHHHQVVTFPGAQGVDEKEVERRALARAASVGTDTSRLKALHVSEKDCDPSHRYKVDIKSLKLVQLAKPPVGGRAAAKPAARRRRRPK